VPLAVKSMGSESTEAWRAALDDLVRRGLYRPEFLIVDVRRGSRTRSRSVGGHASAALYGAPAPQPAAARARAAARRTLDKNDMI
jgi:hypothetical protein